MNLLQHPLLQDFEGSARRVDIVSGQISMPQAPGVYAWCFTKPPPGVPLTDCLSHEGCPMLYVGISPDSRSKPGSRQA